MLEWRYPIDGRQSGALASIYDCSWQRVLAKAVGRYAPPASKVAHLFRRRTSAWHTARRCSLRGASRARLAKAWAEASATSQSVTVALGASHGLLQMRTVTENHATCTSMRWRDLPVMGLTQDFVLSYLAQYLDRMLNRYRHPFLGAGNGTGCAFDDIWSPLDAVSVTYGLSCSASSIAGFPRAVA